MHLILSLLSLVIIIDVFLLEAKVFSYNTKSLTIIPQYLVPRTVLAVMTCLSSERSPAVSSTLPAAQFSRVRLTFLLINKRKNCQKLV